MAKQVNEAQASTPIGGDAQAAQGDATLAGDDAQAGEAQQGIDTGHRHPTLTKVRAAIAMVENMNNNYGRDDLVKEIRDQEGFAGRSNDISPHLVPDIFYVGYLGIEATNPNTMADALTVWCQKARRAILSGAYTDDEPAPAAPSEGA